MATNADRLWMEHTATAPTASEYPTGRARDGVDHDLVAAVTRMGQYAPIHPTIATPGEVLPEGFSRSFSGFLLDNNVLQVKVDQSIVRRETEFLQKHAIIAYFVGGKQSRKALGLWVRSLQAMVGESVELGRDLGCGFFLILSKQEAVTPKLVMLTPHRSRWGTCILQSWKSGFQSNKPTGLRVPTWVTLKDVPGDFLGEAAEIASGLGELLGTDQRNLHSTDQRFCLGLTFGSTWKTEVAVANEVTGKQAVIAVDYCNLPIRCRFCLSTDHLVKECAGLAGRNWEEAPVANSKQVKETEPQATKTDPKAHGTSGTSQS